MLYGENRKNGTNLLLDKFKACKNLSIREIETSYSKFWKNFETSLE